MIERLSWLRRLKKSDPEPPLRLPLPLSARGARARRLRAHVLERADTVARRQGIDRREFLASACGMAATLQALNLASGCSASPSAPASHPTVTNDAGRDRTRPPGDEGRRALHNGGARADAAAVVAEGGHDGGFAIPDAAITDPEVARCVLGVDAGDGVIDVQLHVMTPQSATLGAPPLPRPDRGEDPAWYLRPRCGGDGCYDRTELLRQVFVNSETRVGVVSGLPYELGDDGTGVAAFPWLSHEDLEHGLQVIRQQLLEDGIDAAVLGQVAVMPNDRIDLQLEAMARAPALTAGWTLHTGFAPRSATAGGYWLDDDVGQRVIARGIELGRPIFWLHKGVPLPVYDPVYTSPRDVGAAARLFPDAHLVVYHAAFEHGLSAGESSRPSDDPATDLGWGGGVGIWPEGPYDEQDAAAQALYPLDRGVNSLIRSLRQSNIGPNGKPLDGSAAPHTHVYADCGYAWAQLMQGRMEEAMHFFGKLLLHVGEDRVLWGSDSLWTGNPTPFIQAFRAFEISESLQERHGYPALTPERKRKILWGNAAALLQVLPDVDVSPCA